MGYPQALFILLCLGVPTVSTSTSFICRNLNHFSKGASTSSSTLTDTSRYQRVLTQGWLKDCELIESLGPVAWLDIVNPICGR